MSFAIRRSATGLGLFATRRFEAGCRLVLAALFRDVCRPLASRDDEDAFRFGLRLMAIDGSVENAPNTPTNEAAFGRRGSSRGDSAFVQLQCMFLVECGTHAIVDAGFWGCHAGEHKGAMRLLRSVSLGMLVMLDRGLFSYDLVHEIRQRKAHVLVRLSAVLKPRVVRVLADGSVLARIEPGRNSPNGLARRKAGEHVLVRIITYRFEDAARSGRMTTARVLTTLLDPKRAPALEMVMCYHERWEIELVFDELGTHQRLAGRPLRSHRPVGVIQELYALLIAHYAVRSLMYEAARGAGVDPDRLSFVGTLRILRDALYEFAIVRRSQRGQLYARLLRESARERLPARRLRSNPRVVRRKMSKFKLKRAEHANWPPPPKPFRDQVLLI
jgi:hypothetical protein